MLKKTFALLGAVAAICGACGFGGLNDSVHNPGDEPGGVKLALGDLAVSPDGDFVLFEQANTLAVGWVKSGKIEQLPVDKPWRLAFSKQRRVVYVTTQTGSLVALDVDERAVLWSKPIQTVFDPMVVSSRDDERVAVADASQIDLFDTQSGDPVATIPTESHVVDIEVLPDDERLIAVELHDTQPEISTRVQVIDLDDGEATSLIVPNCSDNIIVPKHGGMALLAPTVCNKDPISVIDLTDGSETFVKNLPGFGPVALGPDGDTAVGFLDMSLIDESLFDDPADIPSDVSRFHLMVIDTESLSYDFVAWGDAIPRYAMTPDGSLLLVDNEVGSSRIFDIETRAYEQISGAPITFDQLAFASDSSHAYVLSSALFDLDLTEMNARGLNTPFLPTKLNISPDDDTLFLRKDKSTICIYDIASESCERDLVLSAAR